MVGGKVIETLVVNEDKIWINCRDYDKTTGEWRRDQCAIYVENTPASRSVFEGDIIWWQGGYAYWTAKDRYGRTVGKVEIKLKRLGYSGVLRPELIEKECTTS